MQAQATNLQTELQYQKLFKEDLKYLIHGHHERERNEQDIIFTEGKCATLKDSKGNEYVDAIAGLYTTIIGHGRQGLCYEEKSHRKKWQKLLLNKSLNFNLLKHWLVIPIPQRLSWPRK